MATTVTVKGQVTIPKQVREAAGIKPGDRVEVHAKPGTGVIVRLADEPDREAREAEYRARLEEIAKRKPFRGYTTDELMRLTRGED